VGAAIAGYVVATRDDAGGGGNGGGATGDVAALQLVSATDFDPPNGDGAENSDQVTNLIDTSTGTFWTTQQYAAPAREFGGIKDGVGVVFELDGTREVSAVKALADESGWDADVYVSDSTHPDIGGWGPVRASGSDLDPEATLTLDSPASGQFVLLWLTRLPPDGNLGIAEVAVEGS
jgi:putative peptidoglycan lipid II flippase